MIAYMRTELYKIEQSGGALVRPLFSEPVLNISETGIIDSVMLGDAVKVDMWLDKNRSASGQAKRCLLGTGTWVNL